MVEADVVEEVARVLEKRQRPLLVRRRRREELRPDVGRADHLRTFAHQRTPLADGLRARLVSAPVLVADGPVLDVVRLLVSVLLAHAGVLADRLVAVLDPVAHLLHRARAGVGADVRLAAELAAPLHVLVGAEGVGLLDEPRLVIGRLAVRSDAVLPMVGRDEAPARPADDRHLDLLQHFEDVGAEAVLVRELRLRVVDAAVDLVVEMLEERAEDHRIVLARIRVLARLHRVRGIGDRRHHATEGENREEESFHKH